ncbi:unnamed protein product, partial [Oppiella nova]
MSSTSGRSVIIETIAIRPESVSLIGRTLREVLTLVANGLAANQTSTHLRVDVIDGQKSPQQQVIPFVPLMDVRSALFRDKCADKLLTLFGTKTATHSPMSTINVCERIARTIRHIRDSVNASKDAITRVEMTYVCGRHRDQVMEDFCQLLAKKQIDLSFLSMLNIVCIESTREATNGFKPLVCGPTGAVIAGATR